MVKIISHTIQFLYSLKILNWPETNLDGFTCIDLALKEMAYFGSV